MKNILLGSTALLGVGLLGLGGGLGGGGSAQAAEVKPGGALDITVSGFARWYGFYGDLKEKTQTRSGSHDFRNDMEVFIYANGQDEATGLRYGARIELEADTSSTGNADETWVYISGNFGEFRFGDEDGADDNMRIGAATLAVGSGGIDGVGPLDMGAVVAGPDSSDNTKIIYYSPVISGFQLGLSYAPHTDSGGQTIGVTNSGNVDDEITGGLAYRGALGPVGLLASVVGAWGHFNEDGAGGDNYWKVIGGLNASIAGFTLGGNYGHLQGAAPGEGAVGVFSRGSDYDFFTLGGAATLGPANVSLTYGQVINSDYEGPVGTQSEEPWEAVLGVDFGVAPGLIVGTEISYFDLDSSGSEFDDNGWLGLVGVRVAF